MNRTTNTLFLLICCYTALHCSSNIPNQSSLSNFTQKIRNNALPLGVVPFIGLFGYAAANNTLINLPTLNNLSSWSFDLPIINTQNFSPFMNTLISTEGISNAWSALGANRFTLSFLGVSAAAILGARWINGRWISPKSNNVVEKNEAYYKNFLDNLLITNEKENSLEGRMETVRTYGEAIQKYSNLIADPNIYIKKEHLDHLMTKENKENKEVIQNIVDFYTLVDKSGDTIDRLDVLSKATQGWEDNLEEFSQLLSDSFQNATIREIHYEHYLNNILGNIHNQKTQYTMNLFKLYIHFMIDTFDNNNVNRTFFNQSSFNIIQQILAVIGQNQASSNDSDTNFFKVSVNELLNFAFNKKLLLSYDGVVIVNIMNLLTHSDIREKYISDYRKKIKHEYMSALITFNNKNNIANSAKLYGSIINIVKFEDKISNAFVYCLEEQYAINIEDLVKVLTVIKKIIQEDIKTKEEIIEQNRTNKSEISTETIKIQIKNLRNRIYAINTLFSQKDINYIAIEYNLMDQSGKSNNQKNKITIYKNHINFFISLWKLVDSSKIENRLELNRLFDPELCFDEEKYPDIFLNYESL